MNSERWSEITKSFEQTRAGSSAEEEKVKNEALHIKSYDNSTEEPNDYKDHYRFPNVDDAPGKVIENLCKIVRDKSEKIKVQEQVINSLNERLECVAAQSHAKVIINSGTNGESIAEEEKTGDSCVPAASLKEIALKVDNLESRLTTVINFIQRKFPKEYSPTSDLKKKLCVEAVIRRSGTWDKPPVLYPKPTYGSFIREIHCRSRTENHNGMSNANYDNELSTQPQKLFQQNVKSIIIPKVRREEEMMMEMRVQALEGLVVLLKKKMMKKINSRRK